LFIYERAFFVIPHPILSKGEGAEKRVILNIIKGPLPLERI